MSRQTFQYLWLIVAFVAAGSHRSFAQPVDSIANWLGARFIAGANTTDTAEQREIINAIYSESSRASIGHERLTGLFSSLRSDLGALTHHHSEIQGNVLHVYAFSAGKNQWHDFQFYLSKSGKAAIDRLVFRAEVTEPVYLPNGAITDAATQQWLNGYIDKLADKNQLSAAILIAQGDSVLLERYVGFADASQQRPITNRTRMHLASGGKMFTALALHMLAARGSVSLHDTLGAIIPGFPDTRLRSKGTIAQLLGHQAGLDDFMGDKFFASSSTFTDLKDFLPYILDDTLHFDPGTGFHYSNSGFIVAGMAIEQATGLSYRESIKQLILEPCNMRESGELLSAADTELVAERLIRDGAGWKSGGRIGHGSSAGGGYSTVRDLLKFSRALQAGKLLEAALFENMLIPTEASLLEKFPYGQGFEVQMINKRPVSYGHGGTAPGVNFEFQYYPAQEMTLVIFCNQDNGAFDDLNRTCNKLITGER